MGGIFGGSKQSTTVSNNTTVNVAADITNTIVNDDSRLQALVDKLAEGNEDQRAVIMATAQAQVEVARAQAEMAAANTEKVTDSIRAAVITAVVGYAVTQLMKG